MVIDDQAIKLNTVPPLGAEGHLRSGQAFFGIVFCITLMLNAEVMKRLLFLFCLLFSTVSYAQEPKGTISGRVTDEMGRPVNEGDVFVYNGNEIIGSATTDALGYYITNRMYVGTYRVQVIYGNYRHSWVNNVPVKQWQDTKINVQLEVKQNEPDMDANRDYSGGAPLQSTKK